jgi:hypothetical protein
MNRLTVPVVAVTVAMGLVFAGCAGGGDNQRDAKQTFAEGKPYFISIMDTLPLKGSFNELIGSVTTFHIKVIPGTPTQTPRFRIRIALEGADAETKETTTFLTTFPGGQGSNTYQADAAYNAFFIAQGVKLEGTALASLCLISEHGEAKDLDPISNTLAVKVKF